MPIFEFENDEHSRGSFLRFFYVENDSQRDINAKLMRLVSKATKDNEVIIDAISALLKQGANPKKCCTDIRHETLTPMMIAALNGNYKLVKMLKEKGDYVKPTYFHTSLLVQMIENMLKDDSIDLDLIKMIINEPNIIPDDSYCHFFDLMFNNGYGRNLEERTRILKIFMQCANYKQLKVMEQYADNLAKIEGSKLYPGIQSWLSNHRMQDLFGGALEELEQMSFSKLA